MLKPFGYSFDRESFRGEFATREEAVEQGLRAADAHPTPIEAVFVGKRVPTNPQADGHADDVARAMRQRMRDKTGDTSYLAFANEHILADLDAAIEHTVIAWLRHHRLAPADKIMSITEHAVPLVHGHAPSENNEVSQFGSDE